MIDGGVVLIKISKIILKVSETDGNHSIKPLQQVLVCPVDDSSEKSKRSGIGWNRSQQEGRQTHALEKAEI